MLSQTVQVVEATDEYLQLRCIDSGCSTCQQSGCGVMNFAHVFSQSKNSLKVTNPGHFQTNDQLEVLLDEKFFLRLLFLQYAVPLLLMMVGVLSCGIFFNALWINALAAVLSLCLGMGLSRYWHRYFYRYRHGNYLALRVLSDQQSTPLYNIQVLHL